MPRAWNAHNDIVAAVRENDPSFTILNFQQQQSLHSGFGSSSGCIGSSGASQLGKALSHNDNAVVLFAEHNEIHRVDSAFATGLARSHLQYVYLSYNPFGCVGAQQIARALINHTRQSKLQVLQLSDCEIGVLGAKALADLLRQNESIQHLDLSGNPRIGVAGCQALAASLQVNKSLLSLRLQGSIEDKKDSLIVEEMFCRALATNNTNIRRIRLDWHLPQLEYWLACNRAGRQHWGSICRTVWTQLLLKSNEKKDPNATANVCFTLLQSRPDLILPEDQTNQS